MYEQFVAKGGSPKRRRSHYAILGESNGGRIWGPYLYPPVTIYWAQPIAAVSMLFGLVGIFASGIGLMRPSLVAWKVVAAMASLGYLIGVVCVGVFGLL